MAGDRWVTVFTGQVWGVDLVQNLLEEGDIPTYLPDHTTRVVDPFITGGNVFHARLQVPESDAERATAIVEAHRRIGEGDEAAGDYEWPEDAWEGQEEDGDAEGERDEEGQTSEEELEYLAAKTRWWSLLSLMLFFVAPIALFCGILYVLACREYGRKAPLHAFTVGMVVVAVVNAVIWVWVVVAVL